MIVFHYVLVAIGVGTVRMRSYKNQGFILTKKKAAEIFCILGFARTKLQGKLRTDCEKYWKEFEKALGLNTEVEDALP